MLFSILNDNKKSIVSPLVTALGMWVISIYNAPENAKYYVPFIAELIVLLLIYVIAKRIEGKTKKELEDSDKKTLEIYDSEVEKRQRMMNSVIPSCEKAKAETEALYSKAVKERDEFFSTIVARKKKEHSEIEKKYNATQKDTKEASDSITKKIKDTEEFVSKTDA